MKTDWFYSQVITIGKVAYVVMYDVLDKNGNVIPPRNSRGETPVEAANRIAAEAKARTRKQGSKRR